jgi:hypothetical protein
VRHIVIVAALVGASAVSAFAQTKPAANPDGTTPAISTPESKNTTAPVEGANSFTEAQAKERMEKAGYSNVMGLKKAETGIWTASGTKEGLPVSIALDFQGNVVTK